MRRYPPLFLVWNGSTSRNFSWALVSGSLAANTKTYKIIIIILKLFFIYCISIRRIYLCPDRCHFRYMMHKQFSGETGRLIVHIFHLLVTIKKYNVYIQSRRQNPDFKNSIWLKLALKPKLVFMNLHSIKQHLTLLL